MKRSILPLIAFLSVVGILGLSDTAQPQSPTPTILQLTPEEMKWMPSPALPAGAQVAMVYGNPTKPGLYVMLVKFPANWKNLPHSHSIEQIVTVLSGTVFAGLGDSFDPNKLKKFTPGSVYTEPLNTPHFTETKEEGAVIQVTAVGPFYKKYVNPADDPRKK